MIHPRLAGSEYAYSTSLRAGQENATQRPEAGQEYAIPTTLPDGTRILIDAGSGEVLSFGAEAEGGYEEVDSKDEPELVLFLSRDCNEWDLLGKISIIQGNMNYAPYPVNPVIKLSGETLSSNYELRQALADTAFGYHDTLLDTPLNASDVFRMVSMTQLLELLGRHSRTEFYINTEKGVAHVKVYITPDLCNLKLKWYVVPFYGLDKSKDVASYNYRIIERLEQEELYILPNHFFYSWDLDDFCSYYSFNKYGPEYSSDDSGDGPKNQNRKVATKFGKRLAGTVAKVALRRAVGDQTAKEVVKMVNKAAKGSRPSRKAKLSQGGQMSVDLSYPASQMIRAYLDPFGNLYSDVGSPRAPAPPSCKRCVFVRGTAFIGTQGIGIIGITPTLANDLPLVWFSSSDFAGTIVPTIDTGHAYTAGITTLDTSSYLSYAFGSSGVGRSALISTDPATHVKGRVDYATLAAKYTGTFLNRSGQYYIYADTNGTAIDNYPSGGFGIAELSSKISTNIIDVSSSKKATMCLVPPDETAEDYPLDGGSSQKKTYPYNEMFRNDTDSVPIARLTNAIMITGQSGETVFYETAVRCELIGAGMPQNQLTNNCVDDFGYKTALGLIQEASSSTQMGGSFTEHLKKVIKTKGVHLTKDSRKCYTRVK